MKTVFTSIALAVVFCTTLLKAQTTIVDASLMPAVGYSAPVSMATSSVSPGAAGTGVTWDFSAIPATAIATATVVDPTTSPYYSTFPTANYCLKLQPTAGSAIYDYNRNTATKIDELANSYATGTGSDYTPDHETEMPFPFAYGNSVTDTFQKVAGSPNTVIITYDGFGTLKTPYGTYTNAVRMKHDYGGTDVDYKWWSTNPLFIMAVYSGSSGTYTFIGGATSAVPNTPTSENTVHVYPNPMKDKATVSVHIAAGLEDVHLIISDITGRVVKNMQITGTETTLSKDGMTTGVYFYRLMNNCGCIANGKLMIE